MKTSDDIPISTLDYFNRNVVFSGYGYAKEADYELAGLQETWFSNIDSHVFKEDFCSK
jgi:hypothetical protein